MKKITKFMFALFLALGLKQAEAQCTLNFIYSVGANGVVSFTANANPWNGTTNFYWYFPGSTTPNGPQGTTAWNASATYTANGTYTVIAGMYSSVPVCSVNITQTISVNTVTPPPPICTLNVAYTTPSPNQCNGSATVSAPGNMCGAVTYTWSNGANSAIVNNLCAGTSYTVQASSVSGVNCCSLSTGVVNIPTVNPCGNLNANFTMTPGPNGAINFNNTSTGTNGGTTYSWFFGDGNTSSSTSPSHTYAANGTYPVKLVVVNSLSPYCVDSVIYNINVSSYCAVNASFITGQNANFVAFGNTSTGASGFMWNFGDGSFSNAASPPVHTYTALGTYSVILTAFTSSVCVDTAMLVVTISTICPAADATFSLSPTGTPQYWNAFPLFPANVSSAYWTWGDGGTSTSLYTSHTYSAAGMYTICLSVTLTCGSTDTYCFLSNIYRSSEDMSIVTVNVINPLTVGINNQSAAESLDYTIYPNPNNGNFNLSINGLPSGAVKVSIYNVVGELVYSAENEASNGSLSKDIRLSGASNGVYFIQVNSNNKVFTKKVVVSGNN